MFANAVGVLWPLSPAPPNLPIHLNVHRQRQPGQERALAPSARILYSLTPLATVVPLPSDRALLPPVARDGQQIVSRGLLCMRPAKTTAREDSFSTERPPPMFHSRVRVHCALVAWCVFRMSFIVGIRGSMYEKAVRAVPRLIQNATVRLNHSQPDTMNCPMQQAALFFVYLAKRITVVDHLDVFQRRVEFV